MKKESMFKLFSCDFLKPVSRLVFMGGNGNSPELQQSSAVSEVSLPPDGLEDQCQSIDPVQVNAEALKKAGHLINQQKYMRQFAPTEPADVTASRLVKLSPEQLSTQLNFSRDASVFMGAPVELGEVAKSADQAIKYLKKVNERFPNNNEIAVAVSDTIYKIREHSDNQSAMEDILIAFGREISPLVQKEIAKDEAAAAKEARGETLAHKAESKKASMKYVQKLRDQTTLDNPEAAKAEEQAIAAIEAADGAYDPVTAARLRESALTDYADKMEPLIAQDKLLLGASRTADTGPKEAPEKKELSPDQKYARTKQLLDAGKVNGVTLFGLTQLLVRMDLLKETDHKPASFVTAVEKMQVRMGANPDGIFGPATLRKLESRLAPADIAVLRKDVISIAPEKSEAVREIADPSRIFVVKSNSRLPAGSKVGDIVYLLNDSTVLLLDLRSQGRDKDYKMNPVSRTATLVKKSDLRPYVEGDDETSAYKGPVKDLVSVVQKMYFDPKYRRQQGTVSGTLDAAKS